MTALRVQRSPKGKPYLKAVRGSDHKMVGVSYEHVSPGLVIVRPLRDVNERMANNSITGG